jgi:hypothetical protein
MKKINKLSKEEYDFEKIQYIFKLQRLLSKNNLKYPYSLNTKACFTQNEIILYYKNNYILTTTPQVKNGGGDFQVTTIFY